MKRLAKALFYTVLFFALVLFFLPKAALYYQAETLLKAQKIILSGERADDTGIQLVLEGGSLYYEDLKVADLERITLTPGILYNRLSVAPFAFSSQMAAFVPANVAGLSLRYTVLDPLHVTFEGSGDFGEASGAVDLIGRTVHLDLRPSAQLLAKKPFWLKQMKKTEGGDYRYESAY